MLATSSEDSSDEDTKVAQIYKKLELCKLESKVKMTEGERISQVQTRNKDCFYYPTFDSVEYVQKFKKNVPLDDTDPFFKKLSMVLKRFPSIVRKSKINENQCDKQFRRQDVTSTKKETNRNDRHESTVRGQKVDSISVKSKLSPVMVRKFSSSLKRKSGKTVANKDNVSCMTECSKIRYISLVKTLCNSDEASFSSLFLGHKQEFLELLSQIDIIEDIIPEVVEVILKIFKMEHPSRRNILVNLVHDEFIEKLVSYITLLPIECEETLTEIKIKGFFLNILLFCENINTSMASKSAGVLRKILISLQYSMRGLSEIKQFDLEESLKNKISKLVESSSCQRPTEKKRIKENENLLEPPDNIKDIDIFPSKKDLFEPPTFLRKNVVDGSYKDVSHYIDVQFRLLYEDFIAPLRSGLQLYCESISKGFQGQNQRFDNIILHENVKILHGTITNGRIGHLVQLETDLCVQNTSKRFIFGSLVLFTADHFNSFFSGKVINPVDENLLIVELCSAENFLSDSYSKIYTMIESEVYFEPYYHVLSALQQLDGEIFPMKEYIVDVKLNDTESVSKMHVNCPSALNKSQKEAFKSAMTNEFVVIQGPPGTGKTFLAESVTKTLLLIKGPITYSDKSLIDLDDEVEEWKNVEELKRGLIFTRKQRDACMYESYPREWKLFHTFFCELERQDKPILVVCYTNHALDQFLERLLSCTNRLIRVGGQSKNPTVQVFNLKEVRRCWIKEQTFNLRRCYGSCRIYCSSCWRKSRKFIDYFKHQKIVQSYIYDYLVCLKILEAIGSHGVLKIYYLLDWISPRLQNVLFRQKQYESWLLEGAYAAPLKNEDTNDDVKPEFIIHTQQLLSEFRESSAYRDDLEMYNAPDVESRSAAEADKFFVVKVSGLQNQIKTTQKKLRKCRIKGGNEDMIAMYETQIEDFEKQRRYISHMLAHRTPVDLKRIRELSRTSNIWSISFEDRWMLYNYWVQNFENYIKWEMICLETRIKDVESRFITIRDEFDLDLLKSANVIGMTTTGAARLRNMLEKVGPEIVIVEEAAEVLEAHVVVALNPNVKKVILIGDHKQLKPNPAVYELAQKYKLDVSLFERMINNGLACQFLDTQHRMRPEIASLIAPAIYPNLRNGERVLDRPDIRGVAANVYFVTHNKFEDEYLGETRSHRNTHEVNFLMSLCQYLLQQDYQPSEITILATYLGQMTALENERRRNNLPTGVRIATVDNYQGEENDIILLSLVRSNAEANIGFLSAENRVCVALSRAKNGLYIIGNMDILTKSSSIWRQVKAQLETMNAVGPALPLGCKTHQNEKSLVSCSNDFKSVPVSGCKLKCGAELQCRHICSEFCHSYDFEHSEKFACPLPCERMACEEHKCQKTCGEICGNCRVLVEKQLPCGHSAKLECSNNPKFHRCKEKVTVTYETCSHTMTKFCYQEDVLCGEPCTDTMECGHACTSLCHASIQTLHAKKFCSEEIKRVLDCGHMRRIICGKSENTQSDILCQEPCPKLLPCGHPCVDICGVLCSKHCDSLVKKTLSPCGHELMLSCSVMAESSQCRQPCLLSLPCGHPCSGTCSADCTQFTCLEEVRCNVNPACGHGLITLPCHLNVTDLEANSDQLLQYCRAPCRADLPCGHICVGSCGACLQGRLHIPCSYPCDRLLSCGHRCEKDCCSECPAICDSPCMYQCPHQTCPELCGDPCTPCKKACERRCRHQQCSRMCSEDCDCPPCDEPCPLTLRCGHPCPGFCGEPCTKHCIVCCPDAFDVLGHPPNPGVDRYVSLENCGHPVEDNLLRRLIIAESKPNRMKKCPICDEPITFVLRFKDHIKQFYRNLTTAKATEKGKFSNFESKMKTEKYNLRQYPEHRLERYGDQAFLILEHLKKAPLVYKTSMWVFRFFEHLTKSDDYSHRDDKSWNTIIERRRLLLGALSLRVNSMSSSDYNEFLTELYRLELATVNWPVRCHLLLSLKKYTLDELKALK